MTTKTFFVKLTSVILCTVMHEVNVRKGPTRQSTVVSQRSSNCSEAFQQDHTHFCEFC